MSASGVGDISPRPAPPSLSGSSAAPLVLIDDLSAEPDSDARAFVVPGAHRALWIWPGCILLGIALSMGISVGLRAFVGFL